MLNHSSRTVADRYYINDQVARGRDTFEKAHHYLECRLAQAGVYLTKTMSEQADGVAPVWARRYRFRAVGTDGDVLSEVAGWFGFGLDAEDGAKAVAGIQFETPIAS